MTILATMPVSALVAFLLVAPAASLNSLNSEGLHSLSIGVEGVGDQESLQSLSVGAEGGLLEHSHLSTQIFARRRRTIERLDLENFHDVHYSVPITVGDQEMFAIVDTGAYELMVLDRGLSCIGCLGSTSSFYNRSLSSTVRMGEWSAEHDFLGGHTLSVIARETVTVGSMQSDSQYLWLVTHAMMPGLDLDGFQAILGLAPPGQPVEDAINQAQQAHNHSAQANATGTPDDEVEAWRVDSADFAHELIAEDSLLEAFEIDTFSVCLEPRLGAPGHITWREPLPDRDDPEDAFHFLPVVGHETWTVQMSAAALGDVQVGCEEGCAVVFDTASPLISVPQDIFDRVQTAIEDLDMDCTNIRYLPTLSLTFGDTVLTLQPEAYMGEVFGEVSESLSHFWPNPAVGLRTCRPLLMVFDAPTQWGPVWVLGMPFFRSHYTIFHLGEVQNFATSGISNTTNIPDRSIFVAQQTGEACERPSSEGTVALLDGAQGRALQRIPNTQAPRAPMLKVDLAKLHPPRWAQAAAKKGLKL